jgi:hypothetical protein
MKDCGGIKIVTEQEMDALLAEIDAKERERAEKMPDERAALEQMFEAWLRLKELGWREVIYSPKDGTVFDSISAGSTGIHDCHYEGEWPEGGWWTFDGGDLWPSRPILFRLKLGADSRNQKSPAKGQD